MFDEFKGKSVLVTGASSGIGAAVARKFGALGAVVGVHYNAQRAQADTVAKDVRAAGGTAHVLQADVADIDACTRLVGDFIDKAGGLDVLINNAGSMVRRMPVTQQEPDLFHQVMDVNATSVYAVSRAAVPHLRQSKGAIINLTSIAARNGGAIGSGVYAASKAAVSSLTRSLAKEEAQYGVRVNAVSPGVITTPFHDAFSTPEALEAVRTTIPMERLGSPEDCVGTFLFLASPSLAGYVTGQIVEVNGGQLSP
ncbi:SDR family oxidoreductase [Ruegeria sp.]|uniref:SDR family NAD(P)-dependent oxidoreductase n=1 Tax=Ruegeria sp. TaxID=1879320 RepID=UPI00231BB8FA|nr:SDR family oxidoreductase [Ruegeria sp.]MDA7963636.1 SDR family oxidoreductase [Ruegeria sp.]